MDTRESVSVLDRKNPFRANLVLNIKIVSLGRERRSPSFLTFNIIISHIFSRKFNLNSSNRSENIEIFFVNISYFHHFFGFLGISLLQRN